MKCPKCGNDDDKVLDSRASKEGVVIRRRRECLKCGFRFTTHEEIDREDLFVVKRDGRREVFQREKLEKSVRIACQKRPIPESKVQDLIGGVVAALEGEEAVEHGETVLAAREAEHHLVALLDHAVLSDGLAWEG